MPQGNMQCNFIIDSSKVFCKSLKRTKLSQNAAQRPKYWEMLANEIWQHTGKHSLIWIFICIMHTSERYFTLFIMGESDEEFQKRHKFLGTSCLYMTLQLTQNGKMYIYNVVKSGNYIFFEHNMGWHLFGKNHFHNINRTFNHLSFSYK